MDKDERRFRLHIHAGTRSGGDCIDVEVTASIRLELYYGGPLLIFHIDGVRQLDTLIAAFTAARAGFVNAPHD